MPFLKMSKTVGKSFLRKPATRGYPYRKRTAYKNSRGQIRIEMKDCVYCGLCMRKCPTAAIATQLKEKVWTLDPMRCINCGACVECCPKKCLFMKEEYLEPVAAPRKDEA